MKKSCLFGKFTHNQLWVNYGKLWVNYGSITHNQITFEIDSFFEQSIMGKLRSIMNHYGRNSKNRYLFLGITPK